MDDNVQNAQRVAVSCYSFLVLGTKATQFSLVLGGLVISCLVFRNHHGTGFGIAGISALVPVSIVCIGLLAAGVARAWEKQRILTGGEIVNARLLKVEPDDRHEDMEYRLYFEYLDTSGWTKRFETIRTDDDLTRGETFRFLINRRFQVGVLEPDLPGGISFDNVYGREAISKKLWVRVFLVPTLTLIPLFGLIGTISTLIQQLTAITGLPLLYWLTIALQLYWYYSNSRHFSPGEVTVLEPVLNFLQK